MKPLGQKSYGSIPHLPGSRMGEGDHHCNPGMLDLCTARKKRKTDRVIFQEKVDGSCVSVAKHGGEILALGRSGYLAKTSPYEQHHMFHDWAEKNKAVFNDIIEEGERIVGEWCALAHGTRYEIPAVDSPFVAFDVMRGNQRATYQEFIERCAFILNTPKIINSDHDVMDYDAAKNRAAQLMTWPSEDGFEGFVVRYESGERVLWLAKWVRPDKEDGKYLPEISGNDPILNWAGAGKQKPRADD